MTAQALIARLRIAALAALHDSAIHRVVRRYKCRRLASLAAAINTAATTAATARQQGMTNLDIASLWRLASLAAPTTRPDAEPTPYQLRTNSVSNARKVTDADIITHKLIT